MGGRGSGPQKPKAKPMDVLGHNGALIVQDGNRFLLQHKAGVEIVNCTIPT
jgi:hypothetical protein